MNKYLKILFFALVVKPLTLIMLGLNIRNRHQLPKGGPAIIAANHNSHLDTIVLMSLYPLSQIHKVRPVAAADYFLKNKFLKWFSLNIMGIIPLERKARKSKDELFFDCKKALENEDILILYPEGSRGEPGQMAELKKGIYYVSTLVPKTIVTPVIMHGLDKSLPKGEALFVPFNCDVIIGRNIEVVDDAQTFIDNLKDEFEDLSKFCLTH
ncbi:lysophospholipid acyltransferase family protein [Lentisphaera profundi]|uniref:Lysophospholipid acyltransferase family protein n=1 Tax=Lentisphaera profundi TaxID=1658616 RepID=A0ABY7VZ60_9BACT|nr:lysophospholipid acyltransferase family protein [Lentisphaera profundi]WDE98500.1 lysophospholipid acyltransferase family protein [Lentisphaera profundi]